MIPTTSPIYEFSGDSVIPEGTVKLAINLREPPRTMIVMIDFLTIKCPSAFNWVLGLPLPKALKAMTSIYYLTMKFPQQRG